MSKQAKINFELLEQMIDDELFHVTEDEIYKLLEEELEIYDQMRLEELLVRILRVKEKNELGLNCNFSAYMKAKELNDVHYLAKTSFHNISLFSKLNEPKQALYYGEKALAYYKQLDNNERIAHVYNSIGAVYEHAHDIDQALAYFEKSLTFESYLTHKSKLSVQLNIAMMHLLKKDYHKVIALIKTYMTDVQALNNIRVMIYMYRIQATALYGIKEYEQSKELFALTKEYQDYLQDVHEQIAIYELLTKIAVDHGHTEHQIKFKKRMNFLQAQLEE